MSPNPPRHSNLALLLAFAILPAGMLVEQNMEGNKMGPVSGLLLLGCALALLIVPVLKLNLPWPERIGTVMLRVLLWSVFAAFSAYAFGGGKE